MFELNQSAIDELQARFPEWSWGPKVKSDIMGFSKDYAKCCDLYVSATEYPGLGFIAACRTEGAPKRLRRKFATGRAPDAVTAGIEAVEALLQEIKNA
jgi:hypothetical protein